MEKKNTLVITILAVVVLLVLVLTATFAYFAASISGNNANGNVVYVNATMPVSNTAFVVESNGTIDINVTASDMLQKQVNESTPVKSGSKALTISMTGGTTASPVFCTYDVVFEWVSEQKYTAASATLAAGTKEFTLELASDGSGDYCSTATADCSLPTYAEKNIASGTGGIVGFLTNANETKATLIDNAIITSKGTGSKVNITATARVYNANAVQGDVLSGKFFSGKVYVDDVNC